MVGPSIEDMAVFCKKKGIVFPDAEIYGGMAGFFDYGPLGVELKNNLKAAFWKRFVQEREDVVGLDGPIITNPKVWQASGHVDCFSDYIYKCDRCKTLLKGDDDKGLRCPKCGEQLESQGQFNLMFRTDVGPVTSKVTAYLRPETAQLIFTNYKLVQDSSRQKLPFGIAQTGKAFRNEISPRDFLFRSREFEQFEIEFFVHPDKVEDCPFLDSVKDLKVGLLSARHQETGAGHEQATIGSMVQDKIVTAWHGYWIAAYYQFFLDYGISPEHLRLREHLKGELAHYAGACIDIEYKFPFGWKEIHGNADRKQFDLTQHMQHSKQNLEYFDEASKAKVIPYVASEPSQGIDRAFLAFLFEAYEDDKGRGNIVLKLDKKLAPIKIGVFPLVNKLHDDSRKIFEKLKHIFPSIYDRSGSIGRRYARADEQGIPYCITIDFDTLEDKAVTVRDRDSTEQKRIPIADLVNVVSKLLAGDISFTGFNVSAASV